MYGNLLSQRRGENSQFYHVDALGLTHHLSDASQAITDSYIHQAYGVLAASIGVTTNPFQWVGSSGYYYDPDRLVYYVLRPALFASPWPLV